jgi:hypothetical protein
MKHTDTLQSLPQKKFFPIQTIDESRRGVSRWRELLCASVEQTIVDLDALACMSQNTNDSIASYASTSRDDQPVDG